MLKRKIEKKKQSIALPKITIINASDTLPVHIHFFLYFATRCLSKRTSFQEWKRKSIISLQKLCMNKQYTFDFMLYYPFTRILNYSQFYYFTVMLSICFFFIVSSLSMYRVPKECSFYSLSCVYNKTQKKIVECRSNLKKESETERLQGRQKEILICTAFA